MSHPVSSAEFDGQHGELLPARTVLSMFSTQVGEGIIPGGDAGGGGLGEVVTGLVKTAGIGSSSDPGGAGSASPGTGS